ncbi:MAG: 4Fe-4S dicluster domain-containing protein [Candidatus Bathyarchaeales archaeon]
MSLTDLMSMSKPNLTLREKVLAKTGRGVTDCFQCMKCTSGCTALKLLELKPHEIMRLVEWGFLEELVTSDIIWACATCLKCTERCPQKASPYHTIMALRNIAVEKEVKVPEAYLKAISKILETGLAETVQKIVTRETATFDRESLKLPKIANPKGGFQVAFIKILEEK